MKGIPPPPPASRPGASGPTPPAAEPGAEGAPFTAQHIRRNPPPKPAPNYLDRIKLLNLAADQPTEVQRVPKQVLQMLESQEQTGLHPMPRRMDGLFHQLEDNSVSTLERIPIEYRAPVRKDTVLAEVRKQLGLAWPVVVSQMGFLMMGFVDTVMVGRVSRQDLAAVALGHMWSYGITIVGTGALRGLDPVFSQAHGAGDRARAITALGRACMVAMLLCFPIIILHFAATPAFSLLQQEPSIIPTASVFCRTMAWGVPPMLLFTALAQFLQGLGEVRLPMRAVIVGNLFNIVLNLLFIYDVMGLGLDGAVGSAASTVLVRWGMVAALFLMSRGILQDYLTAKRSVNGLLARDLPRMMSLGMPVGFQYGLEMWAFSAAGMMMGALGSASVAAHAVAVNFTSVLYMIPTGLGAAAAIRVGHLIGARKPWNVAAWTAVGTGMVLMGALAIPLAFGGELVGLLYTDDVEVIRIVAIIMPVAAAFQVFDAIQSVALGVLRGAGDTRMPAIVNIVGYWLVGLPVAAWLGLRLHGGPRDIWVGLLVALGTLSVMFLFRMHQVINRGAGRV